MPRTFDRLGVQFSYPDNWSLEEHDEGADSVQVVVTSPQTAFWQLSRHPAEASLEALFDEALAALRSEYEDIEVGTDDLELEGRQIEGFCVNFFCLDLTNTCLLRGFKTMSATWLVACQAEDREMAQAELVFRAMLIDLLRHLA
jgi:hypothetical protein